MRTALLFIILFLFPQDNYVLLKRIEKQADFLTTDNLGNSYLIKNHEIFKYLSDGTFQYTFSDLSYGDITFVDAFNPMKVLIFYQDFSRIVFLDNTLSENWEMIELQDLGLELASAVCASYDNGLWVYESVRFELIRFDQELQINQDIKNVQQLTGEVIQPNFMTERGDWLFLNDPEKGIFVFDIFGTYFKKIPLVGLEEFQVFGETIYYFENGKLQSYHLKKLEEKQVSLPVQNARMVRMEKDRLMALKEKEFWLFEVE